MRFSAFVALIVATFVDGCSSLISAETYALIDHPYDNTEVRRLRGDENVEEERLNLDFLRTSDNLAANPSLRKIATYDDFVQAFSQNKRKKLVGDGEINMEAVLRGEPEMLYKITELAIKGSKGKEKWFKRTLKFGLMTAGVVGLVYVLYCWVAKPPKTTTPAPSAEGETTAPVGD